MKKKKTRVTLADKHTDRQNIAEMLLNGELNPTLAKQALEFLDSEEKRELDKAKLELERKKQLVHELGVKLRAKQLGILDGLDVTPTNKLGSGE